jgi:hypothetical protein
MVAWELSSVAMLTAAMLLVWWAFHRWKRNDPPWPLRGGASRGCAASGSHRPGARREPLHIRPLPTHLRAYYAGACRSTEASFSTAPGAAIQELDQLLADALRQCGYPVDTFEHNVARILPAAPQVVEDYRTAHSIALANDSGIASAPDLRLAMFHYHSLLRTLLEDDGPHRLTSSQR